MVLKGSKVRVVRGRKVPVGTEGTVMWSGETKFGESVGIKSDPQDADEGLTFVDARNVKVLEEPGTPPSATKDDEQVDAATQNEALKAAWRKALEERDEARKVADKFGAKIQALEAQLATLKEHVTLVEAERNAAQKDAREIAKDLADERSNPAPVSRVDALALERAAKFASLNVEKALLVALKAQLAPEKAPALVPTSPVQLQENTLAPAKPVRATLDLDGTIDAVLSDAFKPTQDPTILAAKDRILETLQAPRDSYDVLKAVPADTGVDSGPNAGKCRSCVKVPALPGKLRCEACENALATAPGYKPLGKAFGGPKTEAPEAPKAASRLTRCPRCKGFVIGMHTCKPPQK